MNKFILIVAAIAVVVGYMFWSNNNMAYQNVPAETMRPLSRTDETSDIQKDLDDVTISAEDEGYTQVDADLNSL